MLEIENFLQIIIALLLGGAIGFEREIRKKQAGLRTYSLISTASCFLTIIAIEWAQSVGGDSMSDPIRVIQAIITGIGFVGAGVIIFRGDKVEGITTAAGLLAVASIGIAVGFKMYYLSAFVTGLVIVVFSLFKNIEKKILQKEE